MVYAMAIFMMFSLVVDGERLNASAPDGFSPSGPNPIPRAYDKDVGVIFSTRTLP